MNAYFNSVKKSDSQDIRKCTLSTGMDATNKKPDQRSVLFQNATPIKSKGSPASPPRLAQSGSSSRVSAAKQTTQILRSLKSASNPITHSSIADRSDYVSSCCTGHEKDEKDRVSSYFVTRRNKLLEQEPSRQKSGSILEVLKGVRVYLGFCDSDTDIEMRRIISLAGGTSTYTESSATHIVTSQWLSGKKTHKFVTTSKRIKVHVVSPDWIHDSIEKGKRQSEWKYRQMETGVQRSVLDGYIRGVKQS
ncbi:hypothetical protein FRB95_013851 [Tulasnella sp. JGI-2019a]|nr:hypothetical protein FRB93_007461 [Tulasnella sp. JGI-2019a]KAG9034082.1 hypothetical protein FRB95_013851 [Tulasnella sp. JGI-2019a]